SAPGTTSSPPTTSPSGTSPSSKTWSGVDCRTGPSRRAERARPAALRSEDSASRLREGHMDIPHLHDWPATPAEAVELQRLLAGRVDTSTPLESFELVAGCDIAYHTGDDRLFAAVVVVRASDLSVVEERTVTGRANFPYVPGLLSFREIPPLLAAF